MTTWAHLGSRGWIRGDKAGIHPGTMAVEYFERPPMRPIGDPTPIEPVRVFMHPLRVLMTGDRELLYLYCDEGTAAEVFVLARFLDLLVLARRNMGWCASSSSSF